MSVKALRKVQFGIEAATAHGTEVDSTKIWRGEGVLEDLREVVFVPEDVGYLSGVDRTYTPRLSGQINLTDTPATFEHLPYILTCGVVSEKAGSADGAGSGKIYVYGLPTTAAKTIDALTIEGGDDQQAEIMLYSFVRDFSLAGSAGEALMMSATFEGRSVATTTYTAALTLDAVEEVLFSKGKLYIDDATGTIGSTQASNTFLSMNLQVTTGWQAVPTGDGSLWFTFVKSTMPEVLLDITFEHDTTAVAGKADWRAETSKAVRITFDGSALATPGTDYTYKTVNIDLAGKWESFDAIGEQNGNDIVVGHFRARYNSDATEFCTITVVNEVASL